LTGPRPGFKASPVADNFNKRRHIAGSADAMKGNLDFRGQVVAQPRGIIA
jgi:hypothetical protein